MSGTAKVLGDVALERAAQDRKWGVQSFPDGTGNDRARIYADALRKICDRAYHDGTLTWAVVLLEEVAEAMAEQPDSPELRTELVQIAAICVQWVQAIDRRAAQPFELQWRPARGLLG